MKTMKLTTLCLLAALLVGAGSVMAQDERRDYSEQRLKLRAEMMALDMAERYNLDEKQVEERIRQAEVTCWLPLHRTPRVWSDRVKMVDLPLFPSYVFVQCESHKLYDLLRLAGVVRIVYYDGKPAVVHEREIEAIRQFLVEAMNRPLLEGDEAEILCGALKHISGKVRHIRKKYVVLYIEQLGATVSVKVDEVAALNRLR